MDKNNESEALDMIGDVKGKVRHIGSRTTVIESNLGESITVPNRDLLTKPVKVTRRP